MLESCRAERTLLELMKIVGRSDRTKFRDGLVKPLIEAGLLEFTIPDKPRSRLQRYRTTEAGLAVLKANAVTQPMQVREEPPPYGGKGSRK